MEAGWRADWISFRAMHSGQMRMVGGPELKERIAYASVPSSSRCGSIDGRHEIRVPRLLGVFAAGRIMNPRTARSQLMGGLIWGIVIGAHEATELDERLCALRQRQSR